MENPSVEQDRRQKLDALNAGDALSCGWAYPYAAEAAQLGAVGTEPGVPQLLHADEAAEYLCNTLETDMDTGQLQGLSPNTSTHEKQCLKVKHQAICSEIFLLYWLVWHRSVSQKLKTCFQTLTNKRAWHTTLLTERLLNQHQHLASVPSILVVIAKSVLTSKVGCYSTATSWRIFSKLYKYIFL